MNHDLDPVLSRTALDAAVHRRDDEEWLAAAWADPRSRVLVLESGDPTGTGRRALLAKQSRALVTDGGEEPRLVLVPPEQAPEGERYLLGVDEEDRAYFAVRAEAGIELEESDGTRLGSLRDLGALLDAQGAGLLTRAVAIANWHLTHRFCPRCGAETEPASAGHLRLCRRDGSQHFPRTDPAVIMLVHTGGPREKCLLAHNPQWPERRYSVLAGFVEAGESLEQAVVREVAEEAGVAVREPRYLGSQPWPFPRSLMLGFFARENGTAPRTDHTEITDMRWLDRAELREAVHGGEVLLPGRVSIARKMIEHWYGGELPGEW